MSWENRYRTVFPILNSIAKEIEADLIENTCECLRVERICVRAKSIDRFIDKGNKKNKDGSTKYSNPLAEIQDQLGARIITYYLDDLENIDKKIHDYYTNIEEQVLKPNSTKEFSYEGKHFILFIPEIIMKRYSQYVDIPNVFELQIKTLFQHAWAEAEHDINYKSEKTLDDETKRLVYFAAAQAWGADKALSEVFKKSRN